jgi:hypothetical protein
MLALPFTLLAACGGPPALRTAVPNAVASEAAASVTPAGQDTCNAQRHSNLVGQDATALERTLILGPVQVLRPGKIAAPNVQADRINFVVGPGGTITNITCG